MASVVDYVPLGGCRLKLYKSLQFLSVANEAVDVFSNVARYVK